MIGSFDPPIACICLTPSGEGAIHTVAVFGRGAPEKVLGLFGHKRRGHLTGPKPGKLYYGTLGHRGAVLDEVILAFPDPPGCLTGEPTVEINCHGGRAAVGAVVGALEAEGVPRISSERLARRMVVSGNCDALQSEAWLALPRCLTRRSADALTDQWGGALSRCLQEMVDNNFADAGRQLAELLAGADYGLGLAAPRKVVLAGLPNVGKSSLMNCLVEFDRSIVSTVAGTTVDRLAQVVNLEGIAVEVSDTGGVVSELEGFENDAVHQAATKVSLGAADSADLTLLVVDPFEASLEAQRHLASRLSEHKTAVVLNKIDLGTPPESFLDDLLPALSVSATTGKGLEELRKLIVSELFPRIPPAGAPLVFTSRQRELVDRMFKSRDLEVRRNCVERLLNDGPDFVD